MLPVLGLGALFKEMNMVGIYETKEEGKMTVQELIKLLNSHPQDIDVRIDSRRTVVMSYTDNSFGHNYVNIITTETY